jgi:hypothetical protein
MQTRGQLFEVIPGCSLPSSSARRPAACWAARSTRAPVRKSRRYLMTGGGAIVGQLDQAGVEPFGLKNHAARFGWR